MVVVVESQSFFRGSGSRGVATQPDLKNASAVEVRNTEAKTRESRPWRVGDVYRGESWRIVSVER